ncbi:MAG: translation initiation factor IF-2 [Cyanobacteria bacterium P01_F01_bin.42]
MSTRVRIYELSKELSLENKEILNICETLGIAAKSHSSTITEEDATAIRGVAPNGSSSESVAPTKSDSGSKQSDVEKPKNSKILAIHKQPDEGTAPSEPKPVTPASPSKPKVIAKPSRPQSPKASVQAGSQSEQRTSPRPSQAAEKAAALSPPPKLKSKPAASVGGGPAKPAKPAKPAPAVKAKPSPPVTPSKPPQRAPSPALLSKPKPNRRPAVTAESLVSVRSTHNRAPDQTSVGATPEKQLQDSPESKAAPKPPTLRQKPTAQPKPVRPSVKGSEVELVAIKPQANDSGQSVEQLPKPQLKPKRAAKRGAKVDEQEEQKLKSPTKQKRRGPKAVEEDDDIFAEGNVAQAIATVDVSQSLVRPPKPSGNKQPKPSVAQSVKTASSSRGGRRSNRRDRSQKVDVVERPESITLSDDLTVKELANLLAVSEIEIIKNLFLKGIAANINQTLDLETATLVAEEFEVEVETLETESAAKKLTEMLDVADLDNLVRRPPVVTIMGHVDHGKTTLLDSIRETKVAQGEAGGITQHIGAYHVDLEHEGNKQQVVFLDTPGHEAFTAMRARGARVTDIAILVVAADDGVRPQTLEAMRHAQAAEVPIIVAINKMDKEGAQPDRVKQELSEHSLVPEEWGGETVMVPVSALQGENLDALLEMILLVSEVEDLHANPDRPAKGTVIEAHLDKARGPVATLLVQNGTLRVGDVIVAGAVLGKVKAMVDDLGERVDSAFPSFAVEILGMNDVPAAGDEFDVFREEKEARAVADERAQKDRQARLMQSMGSRKVSLGALSDQALEGELKELNLILKTDVQGSVEAVLAALGQLPQSEVQLRTLLAAPGEITETDIDLASASNAVVMGFNTALASGARQVADEAGVDIREYSIIYKLLEDIEGAMEGLLEPELVEEPLGQAEVRAVFPVGRGAVAGCYIQTGKLQRNCRIRIHRGSEQLYEGVLDSLKRMREDVREVNTGYECGVGLDTFSAWNEGDLIEAYQLVTKRRSLTPA